MIERELTFESSAHSADAIQRAVYKLSDRLSCDLATEDACFGARCIVRDDGDVEG